MSGVKVAPRMSRPRLIAVVGSACTGCEVCLDFCPVDCIDEVRATGHTALVTPPIHIRAEECIGCEICAKVCEELDVNAIDLVPADRCGQQSSPVAPAVP